MAIIILTLCRTAVLFVIISVLLSQILDNSQITEMDHTEFILEGSDKYAPVNFTGFDDDTLKLTAIRLINVEFDADTLIQELNKLDTSRIETLEFKNVICNGEFQSRVNLPALKKFYFHTKGHIARNLNLENLLNQNVDCDCAGASDVGFHTTIKFGETTHLEINKGEKYFHVFCEPTSTLAEVILKNLQDQEVKTLSLESCGDEFDLLIPKSVQVLSLPNCQIPWEKVENAVFELENLTELILGPTKAHPNRANFVISKLPKNLLRLTLDGAQIQIQPELNVKFNLESITFSRCTFEPEEFTTSFTQHFNVTKVLFFECWNAVSFQLLDAILETDTNWVYFELRRIREENAEVEVCTSKVKQAVSKHLKIANSDYTSPFHVYFVGENYGTIVSKVTNFDPEKTGWNLIGRFLLLGEKQFLHKKYLKISDPAVEGAPTVKPERNADGTLKVAIETERAFFSNPWKKRFEGFSKIDKSLIKSVSLKQVVIHEEDLPTIFADLDKCEHLDLDTVSVSTKLNDTSLLLTCDPEFHPTSILHLAITNPPPNLKSLTIRNAHLEQSSPQGANFTAKNLQSLTIIDSAISFKDFGVDKGVFSMLNSSDSEYTQFVLSANPALVKENGAVTPIDHNVLAFIWQAKASITLISGFSHGADVPGKTKCMVEGLLKSFGLGGWESDFVLVKTGEFTRKGIYIEEEEKRKLINLAMNGEKLKEQVDALLKEQESSNSENCKLMSEPNEEQHTDAEMSKSTKKFHYKLGVPTIKQEDISAIATGFNEETLDGLKKVSFVGDEKILHAFPGFGENINLGNANIIELRNVVLGQSTLLEIFKKLNTDSIVELVFDNVKLLDSHIPKFEFPKLKKLTVRINSQSSIEGVLNTPEVFLGIIAFMHPGSKKFGLSNLWNTQIDVRFGVGDIKHFEMVHSKKKLSLSKLSFSDEILKGIALEDIQKLSLIENTNTNLDYVPSTLTILILHHQNEWPEVETLLSRLTNLKHFQYYPINHPEINLNSIPASVKQLNFGSVKITEASKPIEPLMLGILSFFYGDFPPNFPSTFMDYFSAKRVIISDMKAGYNYELLDSLLKSSTEWIYMSPFNRNVESPIKIEMEALFSAIKVPRHAKAINLEKVKEKWTAFKQSRHDSNLFWSKFNGYNANEMDDKGSELNFTFENSITYFEGFGNQVNSRGILTSIEMHDVIIDKKFLMSEIKRIGTQYLESIHLINVEFLEDVLPGDEVICAPNLKSYTIGLPSDEKTSWRHVKPYLLFSVKDLLDLWKRGVYTRIHHGTELLLEIDPEKKLLVSKMAIANQILYGTDDVEFLGLQVNNIIPQIPPNVKILDLNDVGISWTDLEKSLSSNNQLKELHYRTSHSGMYLPTIQLRKLPKSLKVLDFINVNIDIHPEFEKLDLDYVYFDGCAFADRSISSSFSKYFNPREVAFLYGYGYIPDFQMYYTLMESTDAQIIYADQLYAKDGQVFTEEVKPVLIAAGLNLSKAESDSQGIYWHGQLRKGSNGIWNGKELDWFDGKKGVYLFDSGRDIPEI